MPGWVWHLGLAEELIDTLKITDKQSFIIGSLLPDTPWLSLREATNTGIRHLLHCVQRTTGPYAVPDVSSWISVNCKKVAASPLYQGWLSHLVLDRAVNEMWNISVCIDAMGEHITSVNYKPCSYLVEEFSNIRYEEMHKWEANTFLNAKDTMELLTEHGNGIADTDIFKIFSAHYAPTLSKMCDSVQNYMSKDIITPAIEIHPPKAYACLHDYVVKQCCVLINSACDCLSNLK